MPKFRKKPVVIEAFQWTGKNINEMRCFAPESAGMWWFNHGTLQIKTLEGDMIATPGDYIIKGVKGECYPCKPDIFQMTYEPVEAEPAPSREIVKIAYEGGRISLAREWQPIVDALNRLESDFFSVRGNYTEALENLLDLWATVP